MCVWDACLGLCAAALRTLHCLPGFFSVGNADEGEKGKMKKQLVLVTTNVGLEDYSKMMKMYASIVTDSPQRVLCCACSMRRVRQALDGAPRCRLLIGIAGF